MQLDNTTTFAEVDENPDTGTGVGYGSFSGVVRLTLTAGSRSFDMDFNTSQDSKTVNIRRARITAMEVT